MNSKRNMIFPQKFDLKETFVFNNDLILLINKLFREKKWSHNWSYESKKVCICVIFTIKFYIH